MRTLQLRALNVKYNSEGDDPVVIVVDSIDDDTDPNTWDSGTSGATIRVSDYDPDTDTDNDN